MIDFPTQIIIGCILLAMMIVLAMNNDSNANEDARINFEPPDVDITMDGSDPLATLSGNSKRLTVFVGNAKIIFMQGASGKFERIKIEGGDTGFYWDENGKEHFCVGGIEVEAQTERN
jgi:hypothetical protein